MSREKHKNIATRAKIPQNPENLIFMKPKKGQQS